MFYVIRFKFPKLSIFIQMKRYYTDFCLFQEESSKALGKNKKVRKDKKRSEH